MATCDSEACAAHACTAVLRDVTSTTHFLDINMPLRSVCESAVLQLVCGVKRLLCDCRKNFPPFGFESPLASPLNWLLKKIIKKLELKDKFVPLPPLASYKPDCWSADKAQASPWAEDAIFAAQRLSGNNPVQIRLLTADDTRTDILRRAVKEGTVDLPSLEKDLNAGAQALPATKNICHVD